MTAAAGYDEAAADRYRAHDETLGADAPSMALAAWLGRVCADCGTDLAVIDLGCGTGRYFWALRNVRTLVGVDASRAMLVHARRPYAADRVTVASTLLVQADLRCCAFVASRADLVYAIGVLAEHVPLTAGLVDTVARWLRPGGRFAFTTVRPDSPSVPKTLPRLAAGWIADASPAPVQRAIRRRLMSGGSYADEMSVRELLSRAFAVESIEPFTSEAHLHCRVVARKVRA